MRCSFVPPYLLRRLAEAVGPAPYALTLVEDERIRAGRPGPAGHAAPVAPVAPVAGWTVHDAGGSTDLPGPPARAAGGPPTGDEAVDEAATGIAAALALFAEVHGRASYDGAGAPVTVTVHYGRDYANAFWDGRQLVFGDGDGRVLGRFTRPVDVLGHELTHAVTEHTAGLVYEGQSGALNESVSDVFAACLKQRLRDETVEQADWLIGAGLFLPGVRARGLRDMAAPGTAYDDPALGRDPQPAHLDDYVETTDDHGGVHVNSGIPNRAFHLAATAIGGRSWEGAGPIWYAALTGGRVGTRTAFAGFAAATVAAAGDHAAAVDGAWRAVGVVPAGRVVSVRRTGGFAGLAVDGRLDLDGDDDRCAEADELVRRVDLAGLTKARGADRFVYDFEGPGLSARVPEQALTPELRRLAELLLG